MRLTNYLRDAFVSAVMQDVPKGKDYSEEIRKLVINDILTQVPKSIKEAWLDDNARGYLRDSTSYYFGVGVACPRLGWHDINLSAKVQEKVNKFGGEMKEKQKSRLQLEEKIKGVAYGCNTLKQLQELLPDFIKYMPEDEAPVAKNLPMVSNIVSDFKKAGWVSKRSAA